LNTKDLLSLGLPLGAAQRRATDFISKFILAGGDKTPAREGLNFQTQPRRPERWG